MPIKARPEVLNQLTIEDKAALMSVYWHRCLDEAQLRQFFYSNLEAKTNDYTLGRIQWMVQNELLEIDVFGEDEHCVFYLTNRGLQTVRAFYETPLYVIDSKTGRKVYDVTSRQLQPANKLLNHQLHLNTLSLDIQQRCGLPDTCYKDSKFASNFTYAQPDGVFELPAMDIFLEMDMAHERLSDLLRKWDHYRNYLSSREYYLRRNKRIIVLFATENIKRGIAYRRSKVLSSISRSIFDILGEQFDCYIGPSTEMAQIAESIIKGEQDQAFNTIGSFLQSQCGFSFSRPRKVKELCGESYLYMRRTVTFPNEYQQTFFLENYLNRSVSVLHKIAAYEHTCSILFANGRLPIPLLVIVPSEDAIYQDLKAIDHLYTTNVLFTTAKRLKEKPFLEALFQFDQMGNRYHFADNNYAPTSKIHEKKGG